MSPSARSFRADEAQRHFHRVPAGAGRPVKCDSTFTHDPYLQRGFPTRGPGEPFGRPILRARSARDAWLARRVSTLRRFRFLFARPRKLGPGCSLGSRSATFSDFRPRPNSFAEPYQLLARSLAHQLTGANCSFWC